ncbi:ABC-type branched-subunit amino acid transport system substrate-binding protein [Tibeticola sediminis]|uniref:ABC-type branched-subunit amino acid transport system substrate-binding protein n=1 Tax=Tibeticola sediminis TaxID=1917811 RepID=A0A3N4US06_9BURK|nr:ABC transporter substrate-binding protein [Tibeticola sediminis]RPE72838.1 ABC-type branched-subunit amino acid transport system substrate-binding protein [Tibeticola sediminis]
MSQGFSWNRRQLIALPVAMALGRSAWADSPGVGEREVLLGQFAALSGPAAQLGLRLQAGMKAWFQHVNAAGGVAGRAIRLVARDDGYEPERALAAAKGLIQEDRVFALVGSVGTPTTLAAVPAINEAGIPLVGMFTGAQALREPFNRNLFHVRASYFDETERIVQHLTTLGVKKIGVFYQNDSYGQAGLTGVRNALQRRKMEPVGLGTVERNSVDVSKALDSLLKAQPEAIVQISAYKSCAAFIKAARAKGYGGQFFNVSFVGSKALADELGDAGAGVVVSQVVPFPFQPAMPVVRDYQAHMVAAGDKEFDFSSMEGYLIARVVTDGLKRAGKNLTRESFVAGLESMREVDIGGFKVSFTPQNHEGSKYTDLTIIARGGKFMH